MDLTVLDFTSRPSLLTHQNVLQFPFFLSLCMIMQRLNLCSYLPIKLSGYHSSYTDHHQGRGKPQGQQPSSLIFMSTLYNLSQELSHSQLTSDHQPVCMCPCIFLGINPRVTLTMPFVFIARQLL